MTTAILQCPIQVCCSQKLLFLMHIASKSPICHMLVSYYSYSYIQPEESFLLLPKRKKKKGRKKKKKRKSVIISVISGFEKEKEEEYCDHYSHQGLTAPLRKVPPT